MADILDIIGAGLFGVPTRTMRANTDEDRMLRNQYMQQQIANMQLAPQELALRGREIGVGERAQDLAETMSGPEITRMGALTRGLNAEASIREQEYEDLRHPGVALARLFTELGEELGIELFPEAGGEASVGAGPGAQASPTMGAATMAVQQMLKGRSGGLPAIPGLEGLTGKEAQPSFLSTGMAMPAGGLVGSPTRELAAVMNGLPMDSREQVMDAFKAPLERIKGVAGQFPGATDADLQLIFQKATQGAAQNALSLARDLQTKLDAGVAWINKNRGLLQKMYPEIALPGDAMGIYRVLGEDRIRRARSQDPYGLRLAPHQQLPPGASDPYNLRSPDR